MKLRTFKVAFLVIMVVGGLYFFFYRQSFTENATFQQVKSQGRENTAETSDNLEVANDQRGSLETINYQTTYEGTVYDKAAQVYLPTGYAESKKEKYDILYLMHGYSMDYSDFFIDSQTNQASSIKQMLDKQIADGAIDPLIVVSPTYYPDRSMIPSSWSTDDPLNLNFAKEELPNDLIPAVEGTYRTYAASVSMEDLVSSRDHRGFGGFSMGAITTWYVFEYQLNLFADFLPMAGDSWTVEVNGGSSEPEETAEKLALSVTDGDYSPVDFTIYATVGEEDGTGYSMTSMLDAMWETEAFDEKNLIFEVDSGGGHDMASVQKQLFSSLKSIFLSKR